MPRRAARLPGRLGYHGFFYHFLDMETGQRFKNVELSSVDTTILLMGVLFAGQYYDRDDAAEREIRQLANAIYERADWNFFRSDGRGPLSMGWHPEEWPYRPRLDWNERGDVRECPRAWFADASGPGQSLGGMD